MEGITHYLSSHPLALMGLIFVCLVLLYFLFKQLLTLALVVALVLLAMAGYFYFQGTKDLQGMIRKTKEQTGQIIDTGKKVYDKGKDIYEKGKEVTEDVGRAVGGDGKKPR
jgi:ABC-type bacteriocin/lantibiotic exporter with double-glycine peptidase domain